MRRKQVSGERPNDFFVGLAQSLSEGAIRGILQQKSGNLQHVSSNLQTSELDCYSVTLLLKWSN